MMNESEMRRKVRCHTGPVEENAGLFVGHNRAMARRIGVAFGCVLLMKTKARPKLEADERSKRKTYRRARKRALARLREGMDLGWMAPRSRDEVHQR